LCKEHQPVQLTYASGLASYRPGFEGRITKRPHDLFRRQTVWQKSCSMSYTQYKLWSRHVGTHCSVRRPSINHFKLEGMVLDTWRFPQCGWTQTLLCLTAVPSYLWSARLIYKTQRNFDVQRKTCLLHVTLICEPKENISSAFLKYGEKNCTWTALRSTIMSEPGNTADWNIDGRSVCPFYSFSVSYLSSFSLSVYVYSVLFCLRRNKVALTD
jgi:hypothetical protein